MRIQTKHITTYSTQTTLADLYTANGLGNASCHLRASLCAASAWLLFGSLPASMSLHALHRDVIRVSSERVEIAKIRGQYGSARLRERHHDGIDGGASMGLPAQ